jgi:hypothetical protein
VRVTLVRLHFHGRAGRRRFKQSLHHLAPGGYTALIYATDPDGDRSRTVRITLTILFGP